MGYDSIYRRIPSPTSQSSAESSQSLQPCSQAQGHSSSSRLAIDSDNDNIGCCINRSVIINESTLLLSNTPYKDEESSLLHNSSSTATLQPKDSEQDRASTSSIIKQEICKLTRSSIPVVLTYLLQYSFSFVNLLVLGHIGADELAAAALANMTLVVVVNAPCVGLASALDTFCSTAFTASSDKKLVGFHLQRGIIAVTLHFLIIVPVLWKFDIILIWLKQDPTVSRLCAQFLWVQLAGALPWVYFECVKRFLQAQGIMEASTYILIAVVPLHLINNYLFVWSEAIGIGYLGAAVANVVTYWCMFILIVLYTMRCKARESWGGWTMGSLWSMPQYYRLAIPSMIMICSEWWILDMLALAASYLGNVTLAAQSILISTCTITYQFPDGVSVAVCNRVGNLLGQGRARRAGISAKVGIAISIAIGTACLVLSLIVASWWGQIYSSNRDVIKTVELIMPACALFQMVDAINSVGSGVLRSLGRQNAGAWINFPAYYVLGFPLGLYLTYGTTTVGVVGLWYGLCAGVSLAVIFQCWICLCADWDYEVNRCILQVSKDSEAAAAIISSSSSSSSSSTSRRTSVIDSPSLAITPPRSKDQS